MGRGKTTGLTIASVCDKRFASDDPFMLENNRIVLDWTAEVDHSHDASTDDGAWPQHKRRAAAHVTSSVIEEGEQQLLGRAAPFIQPVAGGVAVARSSRLSLQL